MRNGPVRPIDWTKSFAELAIETGDPLAGPAIRLRDLASGRETSLDEGSASIAWRGDVRIDLRGRGRDDRGQPDHDGGCQEQGAVDGPSVSPSGLGGRQQRRSRGHEQSITKA